MMHCKMRRIDKPPAPGHPVAYELMAYTVSKTGWRLAGVANHPMVNMHTYLGPKCSLMSGLESPNTEPLLYPRNP